MTLPSNNLGFNQIAAEFAGQTINGITYTTGSDIYNLNYYRGKYCYTAPVNGNIAQFPASGQIAFANFLGMGNNCACDCDCACACACNSCFLGGSLVKMYDGTFKKIEEIKPRDIVFGAFGEPNEILALDWVTLGDRWMYSINEEHMTSNDHPHVGVDRNFYSAERNAPIEEWGNYFPVILQDGRTVKLRNRGISNLDRLKTLEVGNVLMTVWGPKEVKTIRKVKYPIYTKLYNLVVGNSHTYYVDNYAVTGWPREDNFDYDRWIPTGKKLTIDDYVD